jgi:hypothetical protein
MYESGIVDILDPITNEIIKHCFGPTGDGGCPLAGRDGLVFCHGCRIEAPNAGPEYWNLLVPPTSQQCPQRWHLESIGY